MCIFGKSGSCKSFVALDIALSITTGRPFLGRFHVRQGKVLYIYSEGGASLKHRIRAWSQHHKADIPEGGVFFALTRFNLTDSDEVRAITRAGVEALGCAPALVVVDTLTRNFGPGDPDKNQDVMRYVASVDLVREATGAVVLTTHHTGWSETGRERGGASFRDSLDASFRMEQTGDGHVIIECVKQKDGEDGSALTLVKHVVQVDPGNPHATSLVLDYVGDTAEMNKANQAATKAATESGDRLVLLQHVPALAPDEVKAKAPTVDKLCELTKWSRSKVDAILKGMMHDNTVVKGRKEPGIGAASPFVFYQPVSAATGERLPKSLAKR